MGSGCSPIARRACEAHHDRVAEQVRTRRRRGSWRRVPEQRLLGGVAAGFAARTGISVTVVRTGFVFLALAGGSGIGCYLVAWLLIPAVGEPSNIGSKALTDRSGITLAAGLASLFVAVFVLMSLVGAGWLGSLAWPVVISVIAVVLISRNAPPGEQATMRRLADPFIGFTGDTRRSRVALRALVAGVLLVAGVTTLLLGRTTTALLRPLAGVALVIAAIVVVLGPWWLRVGRDLVAERQARIRAEERADMAAKVHDSVLQTLALIQRRASEPQQVIQLARAQERELRSWLFDGRAPGSVAADTTFAAGVRLIQSEIEAQHGVTVEVVTVGDCALDDDLQAMLAAAREATLNAAKWSGVQVISLYAEVEPHAVSLFVRDRGRGFDPTAVPPDRRGLSESVHARMLRRGGTANVVSISGQGTEVALSMPRPAAVGQPARA
jgi:signal transduction histidine kinase/phage shock protein PspC (stress-responsive transcriptional regulator)